MLNELASGYTKFNNDILIPFVNNIDLIINNMGNLEAIEIDPIKNKKLPDIKQNFATKLKEIRTNLFETKKIPGDRIVKANKALSDAISKNDEIAKQALSVLGVNDNNILVKLSGWMDAQQHAKPTHKQADDNLRACFIWLNNDTNLDNFIDQLVNIRYKDSPVSQYNVLNGLKKHSEPFVNFKSQKFLNTIKQLESDTAVIAQKPKQSTPQTPQAQTAAQAAAAAAKIPTPP